MMITAGAGDLSFECWLNGAMLRDVPVWSPGARLSIDDLCAVTLPRATPSSGFAGLYRDKSPAERHLDSEYGFGSTGPSPKAPMTRSSRFRPAGASRFIRTPSPMACAPLPQPP